MICEGEQKPSVEVVSPDPEIVARVAAVDVGKDAGVVCVGTPRDDGRRNPRRIGRTADKRGRWHCGRIVDEDLP